MADLPPWPDVEALLVAALASFGTCGTVTPNDLQKKLPFIRPRRLGGGGDRVTDVARVEIEVMASTRAEAMAISRSVQQRLVSGPVHVPGAGVIDRAVTELGPTHSQPEDTNLRGVITTYRISARRLSLSGS